MRLRFKIPEWEWEEAFRDFRSTDPLQRTSNEFLLAREFRSVQILVKPKPKQRR